MSAPLSPEAAQFHNRLRILLNIDTQELIASGAGVDPDTNEIRGDFIEAFQRDPFRQFIRADDRTAAAIWSIVERREARRAS